MGSGWEMVGIEIMEGFKRWWINESSVGLFGCLCKLLLVERGLGHHQQELG